MENGFPYQKITFILNVISFVGSLAFYYGMFRKTKNTSREKKQIAALKRELRELREQLEQSKKKV